MRARWVLGWAVLVAMAAPTAAAQTEAEREAACALPDVEALCDAAIGLRLDGAFAGFADIVLLVLLNVVLVLVLVGVVAVLRRLWPVPTLRFKTPDRVKEVQPGGSVTFAFELENLRRDGPTPLRVETPDLPGFWSAEVSARRELESGFLVPHTLGEDNLLPLTARKGGGHRARLALTIKAPDETAFEETLDYALSVVPVIDGRPRKGKAKTAKVTVLVTPSVPAVAILHVEHEPARPVPGVPVTTRVRVANQGQKTAQTAEVVLYLNGTAAGSKHVAGLGPKEEAVVEFEWTPEQGANRIRLAVQ